MGNFNMRLLSRFLVRVYLSLSLSLSLLPLTKPNGFLARASYHTFFFFYNQDFVSFFARISYDADDEGIERQLILFISPSRAHHTPFLDHTSPAFGLCQRHRQLWHLAKARAQTQTGSGTSGRIKSESRSILLVPYRIQIHPSKYISRSG